PLRSGDRFLVKLNFLRKGNVRLIFEQDIFRHSDNRLIISALVTGTATKNGRPISPFSLLSQIGLD
ncbi:MAG: acyl-CoA thioesterase, partial [Bacteroidales bacterium]|nr:acyl-CoA thioesterase [Bacteroidales bacterium]